MQKIKKIAISIAIMVIIIMAQSSVSFASSEKWNLREISIGNYDINVVHLAIVGVMGLQTLISIILAISLYKKSKEDELLFMREQRVRPLVRYTFIAMKVLDIHYLYCLYLL